MLICNHNLDCFIPSFRHIPFSSVAQSCLTRRPHGLQHTRLPCPSATPGAYSNSCPSSRWCHQTISSSVIPFSSCFQSFPAGILGVHIYDPLRGFVAWTAFLLVVPIAGLGFKSCDLLSELHTSISSFPNFVFVLLDHKFFCCCWFLS